MDLAHTSSKSGGIGPMVRYKRYLTDRSGARQEQAQDSPFIEKALPPSEHSLSVVEYRLPDGKLEKREIIVEDPDLAGLVRRTLKDYLKHESTTPWNGVNTKPVLKPNDLTLLHNWDVLSSVTNSGVGASGKAQSGLIHLLQCFKDNTPDLAGKLASIKETRRVSYHTSFLLFMPGTIIVAKSFLAQHQLFKVEHHTPYEDDSATKGLKITAFAYDWNGKAIIRQKYEFQVKEFPEDKPVTELDCYPLSFHGDGTSPTDLENTLIERGKRFLSICASLESRGEIFNYQGTVITQKPVTVSDTEILRFERLFGTEEGRFQEQYETVCTPQVENRQDTNDRGQQSEQVIIDFESYAQLGYGPGRLKLGERDPLRTGCCDCELCTDNKKMFRWEKKVKKAMQMMQHDTCHSDSGRFEAMGELYFALLPPRLLGFVLKRKAWAQFDIRGVQRPNLSRVEEDWKTLELQDEDKNKIRTLVQSHVKKDAKDNGDYRIIRDPVEQKGKGLVILLHGVPGIGKTMTAELLARLTKRELLKIGASELNYSDVAATSKNLQKYFELARLWNLILLLDEADVFLSVRSDSGTNGSALVSEMLRILEYFEGVLILTTNRIKSIDIAMQSRIQYAIRYDELIGERSRKVWMSYAKQLDNTNCRPAERDRIIHWIEKEKDELYGSRGIEGLNGRHIRNIFTMAQTLAQGNPECEGMIRLEDIKSMYRSTLEFMRQLNRSTQSWESKHTITEEDAKWRP